ncbi:hypothetical protein AB0H73_05465 [Streptomyces olivoreticuli]
MKSVLVKNRRRFAAALTGAVATAALSLAAPAYAEGDPTAFSDANGDDTIESPDRCDGHQDRFRFAFYYHSDYKGALVFVGHPVYDLKSINVGAGNSYPPLRFCEGTGDGAGQQVANNAASAYNWFDGYCANIYYSAGYRGPKDTISSRSGGNLNSTRNNNRSINFNHCW